MSRHIDRCYDCGGLKKGAPRGFEAMDLATCSCDTEPKLPEPPPKDGGKHETPA